MSSIPSSLDADDFRNLLRARMGKLGMSQAEYAAICGISAAYLSDVLNSRREPGQKLLAAHSMKRVVYYEWK